MPMTADEAIDQAANVAKRMLVKKAEIRTETMLIGHDREMVGLAIEVYNAIVNLKSGTDSSSAIHPKDGARSSSALADTTTTFQRWRECAIPYKRG